MIDSVFDMKLKNNPLEYRRELTIPKKIGFGLELELDQVNYDEVSKMVRNNFESKWVVKTDNSLTSNANAEIVSPVLHNTKSTWLLLKKMGDLLTRINSSYDKCSF